MKRLIGFGNFIKAILKRTRMRQADLAELCDVDPATVNRWVHEKQVPDIRHIQKMLQRIEPGLTLDRCLVLPEPNTESSDGGRTLDERLERAKAKKKERRALELLLQLFDAGQ